MPDEYDVAKKDSKEPLSGTGATARGQKESSAQMETPQEAILSTVREVALGWQSLLAATEDLRLSVARSVAVTQANLQSFVGEMQRATDHFDHLVEDFQAHRRSVEEFIDRVPSILTSECQEAFGRDDHDAVCRYLRLLVGKPTPERVEALWKVIVCQRQRTAEIAAREPGWRLIRYIRRAVAKQSRALSSNLEARERIADRSFDAILKSPEVPTTNVRAFDDQAILLNPEAIVFDREDRRTKNQIMSHAVTQFLADSRRSPKQKLILRLLLQGRTPAEAIRLSGGSWSAYQSLQRVLARSLRRAQTA
jgi:hypothetical protein